MRGGALFLVAATAFGAVAAHAHHSISAVYDRARPVTLDGTVVEFALVHPHPFLVIQVREGGNADGQWRGELDNRGELVGIGISATTFKRGERVVVSGSQARAQSRALYVLRLDRPADGFWYEQVGMSPRIGIR